MTDRIDTDAIRAELPDQRIVRSNDEQAVWLLCDEVDRLRAARELSEDERVADLLAATPEGEGVYIAPDGELWRVECCRWSMNDGEAHDEHVHRLVSIEGDDRE